MLQVRLVIQIRFGLKNIKITGEAANEEAAVTFLTELKKLIRKDTTKSKPSTATKLGFGRRRGMHS